jgi:hypothetical protein
VRSVCSCVFVRSGLELKLRGRAHSRRIRAARLESGARSRVGGLADVLGDDADLVGLEDLADFEVLLELRGAALGDVALAPNAQSLRRVGVVVEDDAPPAVELRDS